MKDLNHRQQALLFQGKDRWHTNSIPEADLPSIKMSDGPNGLRIETDDRIGFNVSRPASSFPTASLLACSFDTALMQEYGEILAEECMQEHVDVILGPGVNHKRSPLGGRNFEYFSEDPKLSGEMAAAYIEGVQSKGIGTSLKHFAANSREHGRMYSDSIVDERTLHEIYLKQFRIAVEKSHPWTIMNAYNRLNGKHCTEHPALMQEARDWGFDGVFVSDWGAVYDPVDALRSGLNLEMPGGRIGADEKILEAIANGSLSESVLHESSAYLLKLIARCGSYEHARYHRNSHLTFAQKAAEQSSVLLKNENSVLPLSKDESIALISPFAKRPRCDGAGSSHVNPLAMDSLYSALKQRGINLAYEPGFSYDGLSDDEEKIEKACEIARTHDKVIVVAALPAGMESEGYDRSSLSLPEDQIRLIRDVAGVNPHVIVVLQTGSPVLLPFADEVEGILLMYLAGCQSGKACASLLYGDVNPSGRLAETWPLSLRSTPAYRYFSDDAKIVQYREAIYTGYRYYDTFHRAVRYPFGYGLSYTSFVYENMILRKSEDGWNAEVTVRNTGDRAGEEVVQLYVSVPESKIARADHELIGFAKAMIRPGEAVTVSIPLCRDDFVYWDVREHAWMVEDAVHVLSTGHHLNDLMWHVGLKLKGSEDPYSAIAKDMIRLEDGELTVSDQDFEKMLMHAIPQKAPVQPFTPDTTIADLKAMKLGYALNAGALGFLRQQKVEGAGQNPLEETVLRQILWLKGTPWKTVDHTVDYMNRHSFKTLNRIRNSLKNRN